MNVSPVRSAIAAAVLLSLPACQTRKAEGAKDEAQQVVVTSPKVMDVFVTQPYVCQIHSRRHIDIRALQEGYLEQLQIREGQQVKAGEVLFSVIPALYKARYEAELADLQYAQVELSNATRLLDRNVISRNEVSLYEAKLARAKAKLVLAETELKFTVVKAPFDGIIDRFYLQQGSLVKKDEILTTLSDNDVMWVYFNVPEARFFEYKAVERQAGEPLEVARLKLVDARVDLRLANGQLFKHSAGDTVTVEGQFDNRTGNIPFRADFPNPDGLLRHGQTGTVLIRRVLRGALVIPQRATFDVLDKRYVYVVGADRVVHQRLITVRHELEDTFVVQSGLTADDRIVVEGVRQVRDGQKLEEYEYQDPAETLAHLKFHAE
jgi:membrane fusion protein (multidrug efflux system)